ncbi:MAG TPA: ankyrin repeat domain-containing protein, partial [Myxococcota bacterium]|nr:ankyrin repeat domain-containing protein [Myxococcota bacterium]
FSPLHLAVLHGDMAAVTRLATPETVNLPDAHGRTPLHLAVLVNSEKLVGALLAAGANPYANDEQGLLPLHGASLLDSTGTLSMLASFLQDQDGVSEPFWVTAQQVSRAWAMTASLGEVPPQLLDMLILRLTGSKPQELNSPTSVLKYEAHLKSWDGQTFGTPSEGWTETGMLVQRVRSLLTAALREQTPPEGMTREALVMAVCGEIAVELEQLRLARRMLLIRLMDDPECKKAMLDIEVRNICARLQTLASGDEYSIPIGSATHSAYVGLMRRTEGDQEVLTVRVDNLGAQHEDAHAVDERGRVSPLAFNVPLTFLQEPGGAAALVHMLTRMMHTKVDEKADIAVMNSAPYTLILQLKARFPAALIDTTPFSGPAYARLPQSVGNCSLKNHSASMTGRLGKPLFRWLKAREIAYNEERIFTQVLTPKSFAEKDFSKHVARLVKIMTATPINVEELRHFFEKPDRQGLLQRLPAEALRMVVQAPGTAALKALLEMGARTDISDGAGRTPLHWAVEANRPDALLELLGGQADINAADALGRTALHVAVER